MVGFVCVLALGVMPLVGCSDSEGMGGSGGSAGTGGMAGTGGSGGTGGFGGMDGGSAPQIVFVYWVWVDPCDINSSGQGLVVGIGVIDEDTPGDQLTFSGQVQDCAGDFGDVHDVYQQFMFETTLTCEVHLGARESEVTVTDPQGNEDTMFFAPDPCTNDCEPACPGKG
jgi:hypothetical protein